MLITGDLLDVQNIVLGSIYKVGVNLIMVCDTGRIKDGSTPVARTITMGRNRHQYSGWTSWVGIAGYMGQNPEDNSGTNLYGDGR